MTSPLSVLWENRLVGKLRLDEKRRFVFQYEKSWIHRDDALPLSIRLPLQEEPYADDFSRPFFANLLPESEVRRLLAAQYGISERNDFGLLEEIGGECAGALSILPEGMQPTDKGEYKEITINHLDERITQMSRRPLLSPEGFERLSLAGAQNKLPVYIKNQKFFLPIGSYLSSHILKPQIPYYEETVENEGFCMMLAKMADLDVPEVTLRQTPKNKILIIKRYDRKLDEDGKLTRIHQEDFCQALSMLPDQKYEREGGPGFKKCFDLLTEKSGEPIADKTKLAQWAVFNYLIGNSDAHAKNISLFITGNGFFLTPFYDLMSTNVYEGLDAKFAMKIGGKYKRREMAGRYWEKFAEDAGVKSIAVKEIGRKMAGSLPQTAAILSKDFVKQHGGKTIVGQICRFIEKECQSLSRLLR